MVMFVGLFEARWEIIIANYKLHLELVQFVISFIPMHHAGMVC